MASADPTSIVAVTNLQKRYGTREAVRGVSFSVLRGEIFGLIGPNGAGKTTTIECILGLREPDAGEIRICDIDARTRRREVQKLIGAALQATTLQDRITPREALDLFAAFYPRPAQSGDLLTRFDLCSFADTPVDALSGGQRQRLALALAFVNHPSVVFFDEPTAGLDPRSRHELRGEIARMKRDGHTVVITTHDLAEAEALCDRIAIMDHGQIVASGSPVDLVAGTSATQDITLVTTPVLPLTSILNLPGVLRAHTEDGKTTCTTSASTATLAALLRLIEQTNANLVDLQVRRSSLEDVFLRLTATPTTGDA